MSEAFVIMTDGGDLIGVAANEEIAIRKMINYIEEYDSKYHWFENQKYHWSENQEQDESDNYTKEDAIADIKLNLQADGFIYAEPTDFWTE